MNRVWSTSLGQETMHAIIRIANALEDANELKRKELDLLAENKRKETDNE